VADTKPPGVVPQPQRRAPEKAKLTVRSDVYGDTVYIDGKKLPRINDFVAVVDREAQKKGKPPLAP